MTAKDRQSIEDASRVLRAIVDRVLVNPEFARHIENLPVPGGKSIGEFFYAISACAARHPTAGALARRRESEDAA